MNRHIFLFAILGLWLVPAAWADDDDHGRRHDLVIKKAEWKAEKHELKVKGRGDSGRTVHVTNAFDPNQVLGDPKVKKNTKWKLKVNNPSPVPCRVRAEMDGQVAERDVEHAPPDCAPKGPGQPPPANQPPTCTIDTPPGDVTIQVGDSVNFTGTVIDPDGDPVTIAWNFPGGTPSSASVEDPGAVTYNAEGTFTATLDATDDRGAACAQDSRTITVQTAAPPPQAPNVSINSTSQNGPLSNPVPEQPLAGTGNIVILGANDLGMHCGDFDHRIISILPPFNVVHAQVLQKGEEPAHLNDTQVEVVYSAASNPNDPVFNQSPASSLVGNQVYKTNFWDNNIGFDAYAPHYPPGVLAAFPFLPDLGLPAPDVAELYLGSGNLVAGQQAMPGINGPYTQNGPQPFGRFDALYPFFITFPFGYTVDVNWHAADGIPVSPFDDAGRENAYPLMRLQARQGGQVVASLDVVLPIAGEADCKACHGAKVDGGNGQAADEDFGGSPRSGTHFTVATTLDDPNVGNVPLLVSQEYAADLNIVRLHDAKHGTTLEADAPINCQTCHYSPALDLAHVGPSDDNGKAQTQHKTMSNVMHSHHGQFTDLFPLMPAPDGTNQQARTAILEQTCYRCHPGQRVQCLRGAMFQGGVVCQDCHGNMADIGEDFSRNVSPSNPGAFEVAGDFYTNPATPRVPWANEPMCQSCHTGDALDNLTGDPDVIVAGDGLRLLRAYRVNANGDPKDLNAKPIVASNRRFAEDQVTDANGTRQVLYRLSTGHGGVLCEGCHGSTHAEWPVTPESGPFIANDNQAAIQLQGHTGKIIECATCHGTAMDNRVTLGGPHGMHPVGDTKFVNGGHEDIAEHNLQACAVCHGAQGQGTVLSKVAADRTHLEKVGTLTKGTLVSCDLCHGNPFTGGGDD